MFLTEGNYLYNQENLENLDLLEEALDLLMESQELILEAEISDETFEKKLAKAKTYAEKAKKETNVTKKVAWIRLSLSILGIIGAQVAVSASPILAIVVLLMSIVNTEILNHEMNEDLLSQISFDTVIKKLEKKDLTPEQKKAIEKLKRDNKEIKKKHTTSDGKYAQTKGIVDLKESVEDISLEIDLGLDLQFL